MRRRAVMVGALGAFASACTASRLPGGGSSASARAPLLAVKIDNVGPARPQTGLDEADLVYVEQVEAGLSRLMAVFGSRLPKVVGPVRSARETDLELLRQFDRPTLAYSGAQSALRPSIESAPLRAAPPGEAGSAYFRGNDKPAPHNLYLRPAKLGDPAAGVHAGEAAGFEFAERAPKGGRAETEHTVRFPAARFTFNWSAEDGRWLVGMDGRAATTATGKRLGAPTVVVQYVDVAPSRFHDRSGNTSPLSRTVGDGDAVVLRDGRAYDAQWRRPSPTSGTTYSAADGAAALPFAPGPVWVVLAKR
ncbi:DUF3048 domain-containing protein [Streptomyces sp. NBC_01016]|uniref:DUF3048 domain-containing protein n=1 Tax=Streptomyces sp. NBC_01016 TaxID=2903720 RepID=UPI00225A2F98|nr:DUF3048 domain-containing protein [Streptomyces sp. NBC_01016]MCX4830641.1 DUF3048 domain-containing protein [Streptomyces sp. NBC_01016]